jgi:ABC-type transport system involved in multi-copper enzyme maturation permease subunit
LQDQIRHKSFYILLGICILLVLLLRGCYKGNFTINNHQIDNLTVAWHASKFAFHLIAGGMILLATLLSMNIFSRDAQNGNMTFILAKPIKRSDYLIGRVAGVWLLLSVFMVILHFTIMIIAFLNTGDIMPQFLLASIICSLNLLFLILLVGLFSLFLPDFISAIAVIGIAGVSFISDSFYLAKQSEMIQSIVSSNLENDVSSWRIFLPKTASLQYYASSLIGNDNFSIMGPVHPVFNILFYILITYFLFVWAFNRKEI